MRLVTSCGSSASIWPTWGPVAGLVGDFNDDGRVNLYDFCVFADAFGGTDPEFDLTGDGRVNLSDSFVWRWLRCI